MMDRGDWLLAGAALYIGLMGIGIASFSRRYMSGAKDAKGFWVQALLLLCGALALTVSSNMAILVAAWCVPFFCLPRLIAPPGSETSAITASKLVQRTLFLGSAILFMAVAFGSFQAKSLQIHDFIDWLRNTSALEKNSVLAAMIFAGFLQSGIFPFNRWLIGTSWAPTPVSALMHAGIVNGGGILLVRMAPALSEAESMRILLIAVGVVGAIAGGFVSLTSTDYKRALASSTSTQMAFVLIQIGLGSTTSAVIHLVLHGIFKAFMFLGMANVHQESAKRFISSNGSIAIPYAIAGLGFLATFSLPGVAPWMPTLLLMSHWLTAVHVWKDSLFAYVGNALALILAVWGIHYISELGPHMPELKGMRPLVDLLILGAAITLAIIKTRPSRRIFLASLQAGQAPQ